ncbi:MAG: 16S rRNA processing protein RimM [Ruminococcaceae bacterium]|nr:16S rRNA processing protein RimM [Oscillospiraceae bacterium]
MAKEYLEAGKIVSTHGVRGEMRVKPLSDDASFLSGFDTVFFDSGGQEPVRVIAARPHGNVTLLSLEGVDTVEKAERLRGKSLFIQKSQAVLPQGSYFIEDIIGLQAVDEVGGEVLGTVSDVQAYPANDVWFIRNGEREVLIPNIPDVVKKVCIEEGKVYIHKMKGLFEDAH